MNYLLCSLLATVAVIAATWLYKYVKEKYRFFEKLGIKNPRPTFLIGNNGELVLSKTTVSDFVVKIYSSFPEEKVTGMFDFLKPVYVIRDPELIKKIAIKDFDHFMDHQSFMDEDMDPVFGANLVNLKGQRWKDMRSALSPIFTSSKMKMISTLISEIGADTEKFFLEDEGDRIYEFKDTFSRLTNDIIASAIFGFKVDSLRDRENPFFMTGKKMMNFTKFKTMIKFVCFRVAPWLMKMLNIPLFAKEDTEYFSKIIHETMKTREKEGIVRPDLINLLIQLKKSGALQHEQEGNLEGFSATQEYSVEKAPKREWKDNELVAQCFIFFIAGFDTTATELSFTAYELANNPEYQQRLCDEVDRINEELGGGNLTYEAVTKMKYMDQFVSEVMRVWPAAAVTDRLCVKDYVLKDDETGKEIHIKKGSDCWVPIYGWHMDPKYFENPSKFDPERFNDENRHNIHPVTYAPFGVGPRNCIGSRFALMEVKMTLYYLLRSFTFEFCEKTQVPLKLKKGMGMITEKGVWLHLKKRNQ